MSLDSTVDEGDRHRLFCRMPSPGNVYLELVGVEFEARPGGVTVAIPADVWERIRAHAIGEFSGSWYSEEDEPNEPGPGDSA